MPLQSEKAFDLGVERGPPGEDGLAPLPNTLPILTAERSVTPQRSVQSGALHPLAVVAPDDPGVKFGCEPADLGQIERGHRFLVSPRVAVKGQTVRTLRELGDGREL
jgi:hypothetical protein